MARWSLLGFKALNTWCYKTKFITISPNIQMHLLISFDKILLCSISSLSIWHETHKCKVHVCLNRGLKRKSLPGATQSSTSTSHLQILHHLDTEPWGPETSKTGRHLVKSHQKLKKALKRICLCLVIMVVAVGVSSNCIWPMSSLYWKGAHHSPRDAKYEGKFEHTPISSSINHKLPTTFRCRFPLPYLAAIQKGLFYQVRLARTIVSMKAPLCGNGSLSDVAWSHFIPSPRLP